MSKEPEYHSPVTAFALREFFAGLINLANGSSADLAEIIGSNGQQLDLSTLEDYMAYRKLCYRCHHCKVWQRYPSIAKGDTQCIACSQELYVGLKIEWMPIHITLDVDWCPIHGPRRFEGEVRDGTTIEWGENNLHKNCGHEQGIVPLNKLEDLKVYTGRWRAYAVDFVPKIDWSGLPSIPSWDKIWHPWAQSVAKGEHPYFAPAIRPKLALEIQKRLAAAGVVTKTVRPDYEAAKRSSWVATCYPQDESSYDFI